MIYNAPTKGTFQRWADHVGDDSYTWDNMAPFMKRVVDFSANAARRPANATPKYDPSVFSTTGGPLKLSYPAWVNPVSYYGPHAFQTLGLKEIPGFTNGDLQGWGWYQWTIDPSTGLRSSAESSYLSQAFERPGLTTYVNSRVQRIILDKNNCAVGVNVTNDGKRQFTISARKEVILAAGPWHSPQLLMVSGIGPKEALQKYGIPVVSDLQGVGQNMWDSAYVGGPIWELSAPGWDVDKANTALVESASGPLTNIGYDIGAFERLPNSWREKLSDKARQDLAWFPDDWPDYEYTLAQWEQDGKQLGQIGVTLDATTSRGNMTIRSASVHDPPVINPNWMRDETDQEMAVLSYQRIRSAMTSIPIVTGDEIFPLKNQTTYQQLLAAIKVGGLLPIHHASASCESTSYSIHVLADVTQVRWAKRAIQTPWSVPKEWCLGSSNCV